MNGIYIHFFVLILCQSLQIPDFIRIYWLYFLKRRWRWQRQWLLRNTYANSVRILWLFFLLVARRKIPKRINSTWVIFTEYSFHFISFRFVSFDFLFGLIFTFQFAVLSNFMWIFLSNFFKIFLTEFLQPQHIWPYIQQNFMHHHSQVHYQGFHVSCCFYFSFTFPNFMHQCMILIFIVNSDRL